VIELLGSFVWYQAKAHISKVFERGGPETYTPRPCAMELPQELFEEIFIHVQLDTPTLKACSLTCRSWYIAILPHLHHTLTLIGRISNPAHDKLEPLQQLNEMGLHPLVRRLRILRNPLLEFWFSPRIFNARSLAYFSAFTNVQELGIDGLDLEAFVPQAQLYFGQFTSALRYLALKTPNGDYHLLLHFLGLFPNLDDLKLIYYGALQSQSSPPALASITNSVPSLRGRLTLTSFRGEGFLKELSKLSGGFRFRSVDLCGADGTRFILDSCADTLETLRIRYPVGPPGEGWPFSEVFI